MKVYSFDIDHNLHLTNTPTYLEKFENNMRKPLSVDPSEWEKIKNGIDWKTLRFLNDDKDESLDEFGDTGPRWREALLLDILDGDIWPSHAHILQAVKEWQIIRVNTARQASSQTLRETYTKHIWDCLDENWKQCTIQNILSNYGHISFKKNNEQIWQEYMYRMDFYPVHNRDLERLMIHKFPDFLSTSGYQRKAYMIHHDILLLEKYNPMQYTKKEDEWEYGHSDDQVWNLNAIAEEIQHMNKKGLIENFDKFVLWNTSDPDNVTKETIQIW